MLPSGVQKACCLVCTVKPKDPDKCSCVAVCSISARPLCPYKYTSGCPLPERRLLPRQNPSAATESS